MKKKSSLAIVSLAALAAALTFLAPGADAKDKAATIPPEEKPFWDSAQAFVDAYAKRDAKAIGNLFTEDAEFYDEFGQRTVGRDAIVALFEDVFETTPGAEIDEIRLERVRRITDDVALEEGVVVSSVSADGPHYQSRYVALHKRGKDGKWRINTLKDYPRQATGRHDQLEQLAWMLGDWINEDSDSIVSTTCQWSEDGNYLLRKFSMQTLDGRQLRGVQRIGWDPTIKKLRSWTFDSGGGFFTGIWTKHKNQWLLTSKGVTADGEVAAGTAVYTVIDSEMITWQYRSLIIGDQLRDDREPVTMVRRPPEPENASK